MLSFGRMSLEAILGARGAVIGMVHLAALPGTPRWGGSMADVITAALADARALADGGADAFIVENYGDVPFSSGRVDAAWVATMTAVVGDRPRRRAALRGQRAPQRRALLPRYRRRDGRALRARERPRRRRRNRPGRPPVGRPRHAPLPPAPLRPTRGSSPTCRPSTACRWRPVPIEHEARDAVARGLADGLIVTGVATGEPTPMSDLKRVRSAVGAVPILVGSGATAETAAELLSVADGLIVGTAVKRDGDVANPVDARRVRRLVEAARSARG